MQNYYKAALKDHAQLRQHFTPRLFSSETNNHGGSRPNDDLRSGSSIKTLTGKDGGMLRHTSIQSVRV